MTKILITLCARGGSKGVPKKNIKMLCGKPLIQYSIDTANKFAKNDALNCTLALSTDDDDILQKANELGLETGYKRPEYLATDSAGKVDTIAHLLEYEESNSGIKYDYILDLDISAPLRSVEDLNNSLAIIQTDIESNNLFSVSKAHRNPYFNMVEQNEDGYYKLIKRLDGDILSRQKAPIVYDLNASFYFYRRSFFENNFRSVITPKSLVYEVPHICFDIDNMVDFEMMEFLLENNKIGFEL